MLAVPTLTLTHIYTWHGMLQVWSQLSHSRIYLYIHIYMYTYVHLAWHGTGVVSPLTLTYIHVYTCIYTWLGMVQVWSHLCSHAAGHLGLAAPLGNDVS